jgi:multidrug efflux system membrane fusion protein
MRFTSVILALLLAGALYYWFALRGPDDVIASPSMITDTAVGPAHGAPVPVTVLPSQAQPTVTRLVLRGRTAANRFVVVQAETAGRVISEPLRKGEKVAKGAVLCRLEIGARGAQLKEAQARLAEAQVEEQAASTLSRKGFAAETTLRSREAQLEAAQAAVDLVRLDIDRLEIRAPFDGILESDTAELGARLAPGDTCATLIDLSSVKVTGFVSEREVDQIKVGVKAVARLINGRIIPGEISFISRVSDPETRTFQVEITLPNSDGTIRDGMTAELTIELAAEPAHRIPLSALTLGDDGNLGVRVAENGIARFYKIGQMREEVDGAWVWGLPASADVIVVGQEFVREGRAVEPTPIDRSALK